MTENSVQSIRDFLEAVTVRAGVRARVLLQGPAPRSGDRQDAPAPGPRHPDR